MASVFRAPGYAIKNCGHYIRRHCTQKDKWTYNGPRVVRRCYHPPGFIWLSGKLYYVCVTSFAFCTIRHSQSVSQSVNRSISRSVKQAKPNTVVILYCHKLQCFIYLENVSFWMFSKKRTEDSELSICTERALTGQYFFLSDIIGCRFLWLVETLVSWWWGDAYIYILTRGYNLSQITVVYW